MPRSATRRNLTLGALLLLVPAVGVVQRAAFSGAAADDGRNWAANGRTPDDQHFSPLTKVNDGNVARLGLAWSFDLPPMPSSSAAPLVIDGVMYATEGLSLVYALDARTGRKLWDYDPEVGAVAGDKLKGAWGIRGLAWWEGKVYVGTQDGRLIAIDGKTGKPVWIVQTTKPDDGLYITGAPRVFNGKVVIGNGGADYSPVRGYVTAYDARTGAQLWRFFTVPGDPAKGFENKAMAMAAKTWKGDRWKQGGGGTVWNAITYDPRFNRIYIGTGNGFPWNQKIRSPGGGDNLFLCSIVALDADTGDYIWHYQTTPGESWDYNSAMDIELADIMIGGRTRPVILHAPKNGFFYVIDRETGKLLSAEKFGKVTWAERVDMATGRPVEAPNARYQNGQTLIWPFGGGAHGWHAMSYNPKTGLVYIPTMERPASYSDTAIDPKTWQPGPRMAFSPGVVSTYPEAGSETRGSGLLAWNPITQREAWRVQLPNAFNNAGTATTAGNLVFQGRGDGMFLAYQAITGKPLWRFDTKAGIVAQPITYAVDGVQYVTIVAGQGGGLASLTDAKGQGAWDYSQPRRILTFALDAKGRLPASPPPPPIVADAQFHPDPRRVQAGAAVYYQRCVFCHGMGAVSGGTAPDLRRSQVATSAEGFAQVVREGALQPGGMPKFDEIAAEEVENVRHFVRFQAQAALTKAVASP